MRGQYADRAAYERMLEHGDPLVYEVFENQVPSRAGELAHGTSVVHPGRVGDEYFMTKGHVHAVPDTAEVYYCLSGQGFMALETAEGEWAAEEFVPGKIVYVPPFWAHRSVNAGDTDLVLFFVYPGNAGHDYRTIEDKGFRKRLVEKNGAPTFVDNPLWGRGA